MNKDHNRTICKTAVLGAGVMGGGIAALLAAAGIEVLLLDVVPRGLSEEEQARGVQESDPAFRNKLAAAGLKRIQDKRAGVLYAKEHLNRITIGNLSDDLDKLAGCDWIIEVVVERLEIKQALMAQIDAVRKPGTIVSTNTSGVSVNAIARGCSEDFRRHFLGTHFFNPPRYMRLFEIIPTKDTAPEVFDFMCGFAATALGKGVVPAKDTPSFIGNRIGTYATLRPVQLAEDFGYGFPLADQLTGVVLGRPKSATFRTLDMVGLDIFQYVAGNLADSVPDAAEKAMLAIPPYVARLAETGALGDKTKQGFYKKAVVEGRKTLLAWDREAGEYRPFTQETPASVKAALKSPNKYAAMVYGEGEEHRFAWECIKSVLLYSAARVPEIADDYRLIDQAMVWGYNWEKGPFAIWDAIGLEKSAERMRAEGESIPAWVQEKIDSGNTLFYGGETQAAAVLRADAPGLPVVLENPSAVLKDIGDGVLCLEFRTKGNTIDADVARMMTRAAGLLDGDDWQGLVIGNNGKNFCTGANLAMVGQLAEAKQFDALEQLVELLQSSVMALKYARRPVVAAPFGMTLGGGMEITLHAADVCPAAESYMGLVEAGVGLVPGAGGCKELLLRVAETTARDKVSLLPAVKKIWRNVATAAVSSSAFDAAGKGYLRKSSAVVMNPDLVLESAKARVLALAAAGYRPPLRRGIPVLGEFGRASILFDLSAMRDGGFVSAYDAHIAGKLAYIFTGGGAPTGAEVSEEALLELEREAFVSLCGEEKTQARIAHMLATGKPLRN